MSSIRRLFLALIILSLSVVTVIVPSRDVSASTITCHIYGNYDGYLFANDGTYATAQAATEADYSDYTGGSIYVGQNTGFYVYRSILQFDTSSIPEDAVISAATVDLYGQTDGSTTDFNIYLVDGGAVYTPQDAADFGSLYFSTGTLNSAFSTSGFDDAGYNTFTLTAGGISLIVPGGITKYGIRSAEDVSASEPGDAEYVVFKSSETGSNYGPVLTVTYTIPSLGTPSTFDITNGRVFSDYVTTGDQLVVFRTNIDYGFSTEILPSSQFSIELLDSSSNTLGGTPLWDWGPRPNSIYLNGSSILNWGSDYTLKVVSNTDPTVYSSYSFTDTSWVGSDKTKLDSLILSWAETFDLLDSSRPTSYLDGDGTLSPYGTYIFTSGIPYLGVERPDLSKYYGDTWGGVTEDTSSPNYNPTWDDRTDTVFSNLGDIINIPGVMAGTLACIFVMIVLSGFLARRVGIQIAISISLLVMIMGVALGFVSPTVIAIIGSLVILYFSYTFLAKGA